MISNQFTLLALSALTLVTAQSNSTFDPNTVDPLMRSTWCNAQLNSCQTLCGALIANTCVRATLEYTCECEGGKMPDLTEFTQTIPYFICDKQLQDCIVANQMDADGQANCRKTYKCGTEDVNDHKGEGSPKPTTTSATTSATAEATPTTEPETTSSSAAAAATAHVQRIGNGAAAVALGLLAYAL